MILVMKQSDAYLVRMPPIYRTRMHKEWHCITERASHIQKQAQLFFEARRLSIG